MYSTCPQCNLNTLDENNNCENQLCCSHNNGETFLCPKCFSGILIRDKDYKVCTNPNCTYEMAINKYKVINWRCPQCENPLIIENGKDLVCSSGYCLYSKSLFDVKSNKQKPDKRKKNNQQYEVKKKLCLK